MPCPCVAKITMRFSSNPWRNTSTVRSISPRIGSIGAYSKKRVSSSKSVPNGLSSALATPRVIISWLNSSHEIYVPTPSCKGAMPPNAAFDQEALRNSSLVANKSAARDRIRCSSIKTICVLAGIRDNSVSVSSIRSGINDSMPSKAIPSLIFSSISAAAGYVSLTSIARCLTSGVSSISRHG